MSLREHRKADGTPAGIGGFLEYSTDLFERNTVQTLAERLVRLLDSAADDPDQPIEKLDILLPAERENMLADWSKSSNSIPCSSLPVLFEKQAAKDPEAVAVICENNALTYGEP